MCTSSSDQNRSFCTMLGIYPKSYKQFGSSVIDDLNIHQRKYDPVSSDEDSVTKFSVAGVLFSLLPIKKLKLARNVGRTISPAIKPVLNGALLVLAAVGLTSCSDITEPEVECEDNEFQLKSFRDAQCIDIPKVIVSYVDSGGNESNVSNGNPLNAIRVRFDRDNVGYLSYDSWQSLSDNVLSNMFDVRKVNGSGVDASILNDNFSYSLVVDGAYFTFSPLEDLANGDYSVVVKNYALSSDAGKILDSSNKSDYFDNANVSFDFTVNKVDTPCTRNEDGYFELQNSNGITNCIKLPEVEFTFTPAGGSESSSHDGNPTTVININIDSQIIYVEDSSVSSDISRRSILEMLEVKGSDGVDLATVGGAIGVDQVSFLNSANSTTISIRPPGGLVYVPGAYAVSFGNFAKRDDAG